MPREKHAAELLRRELKDVDGEPLPDSLLDPDFDSGNGPQGQRQDTRRGWHFRKETIDPVIASTLADLALVERALWDRAFTLEIPDEVMLWAILRYCVGIDDPRRYAGRRRKRMAQKGFIERAKRLRHLPYDRWVLLPFGRAAHPQLNGTRIPESQRQVPQLTWSQAVFAATRWHQGEPVIREEKPERLFMPFTARVLQDLLTVQGVAGRLLTFPEVVSVLLRYPEFESKQQARRYATRLDREYEILTREERGVVTFCRINTPASWGTHTGGRRSKKNGWEKIPPIRRQEALGYLKPVPSTHPDDINRRALVDRIENLRAESRRPRLAESTRRTLLDARRLLETILETGFTP